jgi:N-methylhydantoinase A
VRESGAESVAVCCLFSFLNSSHERRLGEALRAALPDIDVSLSCEVQPEFREYERLSTTVLNAFLQPVAGRYMTRLQAAVERRAANAAIGICQSSGGLMSVTRAAEMPIRRARHGRGRRRGRRRPRGPKRSHHLRHGRHFHRRLPCARRQG